MSWHFLHLGKLVDEDGQVRARAEHRFVARSTDFPIAAANILGRRDPVPPRAKIPWNIGGTKRQAAFVQTTLRLAGQDHTLRVIDHDATEGQRGRGRGYIKRTYLLQPADDWQAQDAALPVGVIKDPPAFEEVSDVPLWEPPNHVPNARFEPEDLRRAMEGEWDIRGVMNDARIRRINNILARLKPEHAARIHIDLSRDPERAAVRWCE